MRLRISSHVCEYLCSVPAGKTQNSIKLEHETLECICTVSRWSTTRGQHCNGQFFVLHTQQISYVCRCVMPKALRYLIPRVEIATEIWFQQPGMLC